MRFEKRSIIKAPPKRVFAFHELPDAFQRLIPEWENTKVIQKADISVVGSRAIIEMKMFGVLPVRWVAEHTAYDPPRMFEDIQVEGPFKSWRHRHMIEPHETGSLLIDEIEYKPPIGFLGKLAAPALVEPQLRRTFDYRHEVTRRWCEGPSEDRSSDVNKTMLIHIVCWKYKPETNFNDREDHRDMLRQLSGLTDGMNGLDVGEDILHLDRSFDTGLVIRFSDRAALDRYTDHPEHQKVAARGREISEKVVSVDFFSDGT